MYKYNKIPIELIKGDITTLEVPAIVNAANNSLLGGGGVDGAIHRAGGPEILKEAREIGGCPTGEARITGAGNMPSDKVIHTVGPIYEDGKRGEEELLYDAYYNSLKLAYDEGLKTIAFPAISAGVYGYPRVDATRVAIRAVKDFLDDFDMEKIIFVTHSDNMYDIYEKVLDESLK